MKTLAEIKTILSEHKPEFEKKYRVKSMGIFGSFAREEATEKSDIDILVEFNYPVGMEFIMLALHLEDMFEEKVDIVSRGGIKEKYFKEIEPDIVYV